MRKKNSVRITKEEIIERPNNMELGAYVRNKIYQETSWMKKLKNVFRRN